MELRYWKVWGSITESWGYQFGWHEGDLASHSVYMNHAYRVYSRRGTYI